MDSASNNQLPRGVPGLRHVDLPPIAVAKAAPKEVKEPRGKANYEAALKRIPCLREVYNDWKQGVDPSDEVWLRVIWPAVFPLLDLDLKRLSTPKPAGLPALRPGHVLAPSSKPLTQVIEDWFSIANAYNKKIWFEVLPIASVGGGETESSLVFTPVNVMAAYLVLELLGETVVELGGAACRYHEVLTGWPERRRKPKGKEFDIAAFRSNPHGHIAERRALLRSCQPPDAWWYVHALLRSMVTVPPHMRRVWRQSMLDSDVDPTMESWGYMYANDLCEELKRTFHQMIVDGELSQHVFYKDRTKFNVAAEWNRLRTELSAGEYELMVEPVHHLKECLELARRSDNKTDRQLLEEIAAWLLLRQAGGPRPSRHHVDPVERAHHHDMIMFLLNRGLETGEGERWLGAEAMAGAIQEFSAKRWLPWLSRGLDLTKPRKSRTPSPVMVVFRDAIHEKANQHGLRQQDCLVSWDLDQSRSAQATAEGVDLGLEEADLDRQR